MSKQTSGYTDGLPEATGRGSRMRWVTLEDFGGVVPFGRDDGSRKDVLSHGKNLSHRMAPAVASRKGRGIQFKMIGSGHPNGMVCFNGYYIYARGTGIYATLNGVSHVSLGTVSDTEKLFLQLGDRLYVYPDKLFMNREEMVFKPLEISTGVLQNCLFRNNTITLPKGESWSGLGFSVGDGVRVISADDDTPAPEGYYRIVSMLGQKATLARPVVAEYESDARFERVVPSLEHGCVSGGRIFGSVGDRIYVSAQGSGTDFYSPDAKSGLDPAILSIGVEGTVTACSPWQGYVIFFTEDRILRLMGSRPDSFSLCDGGRVGIPAALSDTLCEVDGGLYFLSHGGVYRYRGQEATRVAAVGETVFTDGQGGTDGVCYYLCVTANGVKQTWVYAPKRDAWYPEDDVAVGCFARHGGFACMQSGDGFVWITSSEGREPSVNGREEMNVGLIRSELVTRPLCASFPETSCPVEVVARVSCNGVGSLEIYASYDGGEEIRIGQFNGNRAKSVIRMPMPVASAYGVSLRLVMTGEWVISSVSCGFDA